MPLAYIIMPLAYIVMPLAYIIMPLAYIIMPFLMIFVPVSQREKPLRKQLFSPLLLFFSWSHTLFIEPETVKSFEISKNLSRLFFKNTQLHMFMDFGKIKAFCSNSRQYGIQAPIPFRAHFCFQAKAYLPVLQSLILVFWTFFL